MSDSPSYPLTTRRSSPPLGIFGPHHYYVEAKKRVILYVLFCWSLLPLLLCTVDAWILIRRGREEFIEKHGDEKDLEEYYAEQLSKRNPGVVDLEEIKDQDSDRDDGDKDEDNNISEPTGTDENNDANYSDPDYSDYYGNWD